MHVCAELLLCCASRIWNKKPTRRLFSKSGISSRLGKLRLSCQDFVRCYKLVIIWERIKVGLYYFLSNPFWVVGQKSDHSKSITERIYDPLNWRDSGLFWWLNYQTWWKFVQLCHAAASRVVASSCKLMYRFAQQDNFRLVIELVYTLDMAITSNGKVNLKSDFTQATAGKKLHLRTGLKFGTRNTFQQNLQQCLCWTCAKGGVLFWF